MGDFKENQGPTAPEQSQFGPDFGPNGFRHHARPGCFGRRFRRCGCDSGYRPLNFAGVEKEWLYLSRSNENKKCDGQHHRGPFGRFGPFGPQSDHFGPNGHWFNDGRFGPNDGRFGPQDGQFGPNESRFGRFGPHPGHFRPGHGPNFGPSCEK